MAAAIVVGGRTFAPVDPDALTARRDDWIQVRIIDAKLDKLPTVLQEEDAAREILLRALRSGAKPHLLAGMFDEIGVDGRVVPWTPDRAADLAEFFACLTAQADRLALNDAFLGVLLGFFGVALGSSASSLTSGKSPSASPTPAVSSPASPGSTSSSAPSRPIPPSNMLLPDGASRPRAKRPRASLVPTPSAPGLPSPA